MVKEWGTTKVVTWFDYAAGRKVKDAAEVGFTMKVEAGQATVVSMEMRVEGETELK